jgi:hypothetical protein
MTDELPDDPSADDGAVDAGLGAAVDDAMAAEVKRQRARFIQRIVGLDRAEGVGRSEAHRDDSTYRDLDPDRRDDTD